MWLWGYYPPPFIYDTLLLKMDSPFTLWFGVIELGDITIYSETPLAEVLWFIGGHLLLAAISLAVLWWNRRARPDPFA